LSSKSFGAFTLKRQSHPRALNCCAQKKELREEDEDEEEEGGRYRIDSLSASAEKGKNE
jgi:hypothetical protein